MKDSSTFADNINLILDEIMSEELLADISDINQSTISRISAGVTPNPYKKTRLKIAKALNIELDYLDNNTLTQKDLAAINFEHKTQNTLQWLGTDEDTLNMYSFRKPIPNLKSFKMVVDQKHSTAMMPVGARLEFICDVAFENDIVAFINNGTSIDIAKVIRARRESYTLDIIPSATLVKVEHNRILGVLKNIHF